MKGKYTPINPHKYMGDLGDIVFRSSWERQFMQYCDRSPAVLKWNSEGVVIPYYSSIEGKNRRYFVDFAVVFNTDKGPKKVLIEIKPAKQTRPSKARKPENLLKENIDYQINQDKWAAAEKWCSKNGAQFIVVTENDLGIKSI